MHVRVSTDTHQNLTQILVDTQDYRTTDKGWVSFEVLSILKQSIASPESFCCAPLTVCLNICWILYESLVIETRYICWHSIMALIFKDVSLRNTSIQMCDKNKCKYALLSFSDGTCHSSYSWDTNTSILWHHRRCSWNLNVSPIAVANTMININIASDATGKTNYTNSPNTIEVSPFLLSELQRYFPVISNYPALHHQCMVQQVHYFSV